jgi:AraC family transcriptional regulator
MTIGSLTPELLTQTTGPQERFRLNDEHRCQEPAVKISPPSAAKRHSVSWHDLIVENIYIPAQSSIECRYSASSHLLVMYVDGVRCDGKTSINGWTPATPRKINKKLTFVPANHAYSECHKTQTPMRMAYLYFSPAKLDGSFNEGMEYPPKVFFDDTVVWDSATKLMRVIESRKSGPFYLNALTNVLACELIRPSPGMMPDSAPSRGGLAGWQMRIVAQHIEGHLADQISMTTLARLARLSESHFSRSFKQSFGVPPHEYLVQRRMEKAKALLAERASVTDVGFALGYSYTSSFSAAFRKITGHSPRTFSRALE